MDSENKGGQPTAYTPEKAALICWRMMKGESLRQICRDPAMPNRDTVYNWLVLFPEFSDQYMRCRDIQADEMFDEILEIADLKSSDYRVDEYGNEKPDHEHIQRSRLRIDTRKWYLSKVLPKKYGDKSDESKTQEAPSVEGTVINGLDNASI